MLPFSFTSVEVSCLEMAKQADGMVLRVDGLQIIVNGYHVDFMTVHW